MAAYAMAHLYDPKPHAEVADYIERIQATMDPFGGRFLVHGPAVDVKEGEWPGTLVIVEFPDVEAANAWYESPAYQEILPLRTDHIRCDTLIAPGVADGYDATASAAAMRQFIAG